MSTKNLARTVLERGRPTADKFFRRYRNRQERRALRDYLHAVEKDQEFYYDRIEPDHKHSADWHGPVLTDQLTPVYAWVDKQIGKNWADVRRDIKEKFDVRTLAGFHVVYQHILRDIAGSGEEEYMFDGVSNCGYYIDENNLLQSRYNKHGFYTLFAPSSSKEPFSEEQKQELIEWLDKRKVVFVNGRLYWFVCDHPNRVKIEFSWMRNRIEYFESFGAREDFYYRRERRLDKKEVNYFRSLPGWVQEALLACRLKVK